MAVKAGTEEVGGMPHWQKNAGTTGSFGCGCSMEDVGWFYAERDLADSNMVCADVPRVVKWNICDVSLASLCIAQTCGERKKPSVNVSLSSMCVEQTCGINEKAKCWCFIIKYVRGTNLRWKKKAKCWCFIIKYGHRRKLAVKTKMSGVDII